MGSLWQALAVQTPLAPEVYTVATLRKQLADSKTVASKVVTTDVHSVGKGSIRFISYPRLRPQYPFLQGAIDGSGIHNVERGRGLAFAARVEIVDDEGGI